MLSTTPKPPFKVGDYVVRLETGTNDHLTGYIGIVREIKYYERADERTCWAISLDWLVGVNPPIPTGKLLTTYDAFRFALVGTQENEDAV